MTVLVGVRCTDGVVIGADSMATSVAGVNPLAGFPTDKLSIIDGKVILAGTGAVGLGQRFQAIVDSHWKKKTFQKSCVECTKLLSANTINDFQSTGLRPTQHGYGFGALVAAPMEKRAELVEFGVADFQPERKDGKLNFVTMGSGQLLADPFMAFLSRVLWSGEQPDVKHALFGVYWALNHTIKYAPSGVGGPIKLATLQKANNDWSARILSSDELEETSQHIELVEEQIGKLPEQLLDDGNVEPVPTL